MKKNKIIEVLRPIYTEMLNSSEVQLKLVNNVHPKNRLSAENLYHYLLLRGHDIRSLHDHLSDLGISSLGSAEGYVLHKLSAILRLLEKSDDSIISNPPLPIRLDYSMSKKLLKEKTDLLFGESTDGIDTRIMVTLPNEAATDLDLVRKLLKEGMRIARINLSHGDKKLWKSMIANIKKASKKEKVKIKIFMDLPGPKIRTSEIKIIPKKGKEKSFLKISQGSIIKLTKSLKSTQLLKSKTDNFIQEVGVLMPEIIDPLKLGHRVYFDDGKIEGVVIDKTKSHAKIKITQCIKQKLHSNKGINLPDTTLKLKSLTNKDIALLPFITKYADILGYSFVRSPKDIHVLYKYLKALKNEKIGVVLKIETSEAFSNLPLLIFKAMERKNIGLMIARGDLAVEIGYDRISEVQNQVLWLGEAAHIPVIWATQVLENYAKTGIPTRSEISDVALSASAECVMLNKGPYIKNAVKLLNNILGRMEAHSFKKKNSMRALKVAKTALEALA